MLLLKPYTILYCGGGNTDLHFTMLLLKHYKPIATLQILAGFTFHYASIKTNAHYTARLLKDLFTFHYASIKTAVQKTSQPS